MGQKMCDRLTPSQKLKRSSAIVLTRRLYHSVQSKVSGEWIHDEKPHAIDEGRSNSVIEFRLREWPTNYCISVHSDAGGSILGYGVFRRRRLLIPFTHDQLAKHLEEHVPGGIDRKTDKLWAWYREIDKPLRDFSQQQTLIEVEKIRQREDSKCGDAFRRVSGNLASLAVALEDWFLKVGNRFADAPISPLVAAEPL